MPRKIYNGVGGLLKVLCALVIGKECVWEAIRLVARYIPQGFDPTVFTYMMLTALGTAGYIGLFLRGSAQVISVFRPGCADKVKALPMDVLLLLFGSMPWYLMGDELTIIVQVLHWIAVCLTLIDLVVLLIAFRREKTPGGAKRWKVLYGTALMLVPALLLCLGITLQVMIRENLAVIRSNEAMKGGFDSFTMTDFDGNVYTQDVFKGHKLTMLNIWGTYCGPCIREMPDLQEISEEYDPARFRILGMVGDVYVNGQLDPDLMTTATEIMEVTGVKYPVLIPSAEINAGVLDYVAGFPTTLFFNENGEQVETVLGGKDKEGWIELIEELLDHEE